MKSCDVNSEYTKIYSDYEKSKINTKKFVNEIFDSNYNSLENFNFDWLNSISCNAEILQLFSTGTNLDIKKLELLYKYRGNSTDPDSMDIVHNIMMCLYDFETLKIIYDNFIQERRVHLEDLIELSKTLTDSNKINKIKEMISFYCGLSNRYMFKGDTMNTFNSMLGKHKPPYLKHIWHVNQFETYSTLESNKLNELKLFYNKYHSIANFHILPL